MKCEEKPTINPRNTGQGWVGKVFENHRGVRGGYPFHLLRTSDGAFLFHLVTVLQLRKGLPGSDALSMISSSLS